MPAYNEQQVNYATDELAHVMELRRSHGGYRDAFRTQWRGDMDMFASRLAEIAGLQGAERAVFKDKIQKGCIEKLNLN